MLPALALAAALAATPQEPVVETPVDIQGWRFAAIPLVSFGSDVGLTLGAALFFYRPVSGHKDEMHSLTLGASYSTRGPKSIDAGVGFRRLLGTSLRFFLNVHAADDDRMPYWGEGAALGGLPTPPGFGSPPEPYRYRDRRLFASATLAAAIAGPVGWHLRARWVNVDIAERSALLTASAPPGVGGGKVGLGEVGLWWDSRDRELNTRSGAFVSAAAFAAPRVGGLSDFSFHGYDAAVRVYVPLWFGSTLALRALYDRKIPGLPGAGPATNAAVPFFERMMYEGQNYNEGLGGASTVRGIARYRIAGEEKALGNAQLRLNLFTTHLASKTQEWGLGAGIDAGWARQRGFSPVHDAGAAAGLRFIWDRAILFRVELGQALSGGERTLYIAFGEQF